MKKLIEALNIFLKYRDDECPTYCDNKILMIVGISEEAVSAEDKIKLNDLSFFWSKEYDCWVSYYFGGLKW